LYEKVRDLNLEATEVDGGIWLHKLEVSCDLRSRIVQAQDADDELQKIIQNSLWLRTEQFCSKEDYVYRMIWSLENGS
jgi:hypothetical protein